MRRDSQVSRYAKRYMLDDRDTFTAQRLPTEVMMLYLAQGEFAHKSTAAAGRLRGIGKGKARARGFTQLSTLV